ncbi:hypothetical protein GBA52_023979 [Prunus armeniaca]|nr:hypothetical protein GBA52_023979 [Prunus armeniaca]
MGFGLMVMSSIRLLLKLSSLDSQLSRLPIEPYVTSQDNVNLLAPVTDFELECAVKGIGAIKLDLEKAYDLLD